MNVVVSISYVPIKKTLSLRECHEPVFAVIDLLKAQESGIAQFLGEDELRRAMLQIWQ